MGISLFSTNGTRESGSASPLFGEYVNFGTSQLTINVYCRQIYSANRVLFLKNPGGGGANTSCFHIEEVAR